MTDGAPLVTGTIDRLTSVVHASVRPTSFAVYAISRPSGENEYPSLPPNGPGGTSYFAPGVRSRGASPSMPTTNRCERVPSSHAFQWRKSRLSATCAFTLLSWFALSFSALHASVVQSGQTADTNARRSPFADQTGPLAPPFSAVSLRRSLPSAF